MKRGGISFIMEKSLIKRFSIIVLLIVVCATFLFSCDCFVNNDSESTDYNLEYLFFFSRDRVSRKDAVKGLKDSFWESNATRGIILANVDGKLVRDEVSPTYWGYIIKTQEELSEFFDILPDVDFSTQMVVIIVFSTTMNTTHDLKSIKQDGDDLEIELTSKYESSNSAQPMPVQKGWGWKQDKLDVDHIILRISSKK